MIFELAIIIVISSLSFLLGFFVFLKNPKNNAHKFLALMCVNSSIWALIIVLENIIGDREKIILLNKIDFTIGPFITYFLLLFCKSFGSKKSPSKIKHVLFLIPPAALSIISIFSNLLVDHVEFINDNNPVLIKGPLFFLMYIYFQVYTIWSFIILISKYRSFFGIRKRQILYFIIGLFGTSFFWLSGSFISLFLPLHKEDFLGLWSRYSIYAIFSCTFFFAYAIVRYRFMDLRVIIKRRVINFLLLILSLVIYTYAILYLEKVLKYSLKTSSFITIFLAVIIIALGFPLWKNLIGKFSNKFIKEKYNFEKIVADLTPVLEKTFKIKDFFQILSLKLRQVLSIEKTHLFLFDSQGKISQKYSEDMKLDLNPIIPSLFSYFKEEKRSLIVQEMPFMLEEKIFIPFYLMKSQKEIDYLKRIKAQKERLQEIEKILTKAKIGIVLPLKSEDRIIGILFLGNKASRNIFTQNEINFIENLGEKVSGALQNILLYQQTIERIKK